MASNLNSLPNFSELAQTEQSNASATSASSNAFTDHQKEYLDGYLRAIAGNQHVVLNSPGLNPFSIGTPQGLSSKPHAPEKPGNTLSDASVASPYGGAENIGYRAQKAWLAAGRRLSKEEQLKFENNPLESWDSLVAHSLQNKLPEGADIFRFKFHGLFNVAPAQTGMMCRMRIPGGALTADQLVQVANCAENYGGGYADITTRANLQIREIAAEHMETLLLELHQAGIVPRGSGADNIRNVTGNPTAGLDSQELYDVLPLCRQLHHLILHHRELYGLPRKFNIAFDGGNCIGSLEDTNDIGFRAVSMQAESGLEPGIYFRCYLGGISGHQDFARDAGLLLRPQECTAVAVAMVKVFIQNGDRSNRKKARLKYVLDAKGFGWFLEETQKLLAFSLRKAGLSLCQLPAPEKRAAHMGAHEQKQKGLFWVGVDVNAGRLTLAQMRGLAKLATQHGTGDIRLTVWQNLLLTNIAENELVSVFEGLQQLGLSHQFDAISSGVVACTGSEGCKFGQAPTKATAKAIIEKLRGKFDLQSPINIHITGCNHSCAQHFIGDIGLIATQVESDGRSIPGFHVFIGGGWKDKARIAFPVAQSISATQIPASIEAIVMRFLEKRQSQESFTEFTARLSDAELQAVFALMGSENRLPVAA